MVETDLRISQAGPAGTLLSTDKVPLARAGNTAALAAQVSDITNYLLTQTPFGEAPLDGNVYGRSKASWVAAVPLTGGPMLGALALASGSTALTASPGDSSNLISNTAFVANAVSKATSGGPFVPVSGTTMTGPLALFGGDTVPTASPGDSSNLVSNTAFVANALSNFVPTGGPFVPLAGNVTVAGPTTFGATGTGLTVTNNATIGNVATIGSGTQNRLVITPGATTSSDITIQQQGTARLNLNRTLVGGGSFNMAQGGATALKLLDAAHTASGSLSAGSANSWNRIATLSDTAATTGVPYVSALEVDMTTATGAAGNRNTLTANLTIPVSMGAGGGNQQHVAAEFNAQITAAQGGTSPHGGQSAGSVFGTNPNVIARSGATALSGVIGEEVDVAVATGASTQEKIGIQVVKTSADAIQAGDVDSDSAIRVLDQVGASAWRQIYDIGGYIAQWPGDVNTTLIRARPTSGVTAKPIGALLKPPLASLGIDFARISFATASAKLPGLTVGPTGTLSANAVRISTTSGVTAIDAVYSQVTAVAIQTAGTGYYVGDLVNTPDGSIVQVTAVTGTVPTALSIVVPGYATSPPTNPVATNDGSGNGLTVNFTWTAANTLALNPSGGAVTVNGGCTITSGSAAPAATQPAGSIYMRTGGASGARLYVSAGGGTWAAVAGV